MLYLVCLICTKTSIMYNDKLWFYGIVCVELSLGAASCSFTCTVQTWQFRSSQTNSWQESKLSAFPKKKKKKKSTYPFTLQNWIWCRTAAKKEERFKYNGSIQTPNLRSEQMITDGAKLWRLQIYKLDDELFFFFPSSVICHFTEPMGI